ncbi:MAG: hypothetical protein ACHQKZ_02060 [Solirubrobacterales bacterium]|jgi:hypothetical protein
MNAPRSLAIILSLSLIVSAMPAMAAAGEAAPVVSGTPLRTSIDRALLASPPQVRQASGKARAMQANGTTGGGGGGGHTAMVLLGLAVSAASTYLVIKQVNKTTEQVPPPAMKFGVTIRR